MSDCVRHFMTIVLQFTGSADLPHTPEKSPTVEAKEIKHTLTIVLHIK